MSFNTRTEELLTTLVSFDTTSACSNLELIDFVEGMLREVGIASRITFNAARTKANLFATLRGGDETERPCAWSSQDIPTWCQCGVRRGQATHLR